MSRYGRRARHPHVSPEMKRRLELERRRDEAASAIEGKTDDVTETKHGGNPNLDPLEPRQMQEQDENSVTAVVTVVDIVVDSGSRTIGQFTVPTLPATISDSSLGYFTIPSDLTTPITVSSTPASPETATSTPSGNSGSPSPSVTPTPTRDSRLPTPSDHFFSHIPSSSRAIPSPSALFSGSSSVSSALATSASSASTSISTSGSRSSISTIQSVLSSSSSSASSSGVTSSSAQSSTFGSTNGYSTSAATTGAGAGAGGSISGSGNSGQPSSGDDSNSQGSGSGSSSGINTPRVVGGVVGGVAGAFFLFLLALLVLRWRKKYAHKTRGALASDDATSGAARSESGAPNAEMMSQRSSVTPLAAAAASAGFFNRWRNSTQTVSTQDTTPSERGFQKISGRKIPSVLRTGGDGYGSGGEEEIVPGAAASSTDLSPRPGHLATAPTIVETTAEGDEHFIPFDRFEPPLSASTTRASDVDRMDGVFMRPSPARSPVASTVNLPESGQSIPTRQGTRASSIPRRPDLIGRSHPSWDGSRGSRFTESID